ncbi:TMEM43 family protein [Anatilimnocola floriformis]|uniref:TMEM43 family protein n=1 Tax=Anatilimnocola floriformis TaxID=2948575 RepID=UPI0020C2BCD2|nr:TMEM43 family protein [Anatilimnocola floriformis]
MSDSYTVNNNSSFGSRIGGAIMGMLIAPVLLLGGSCFLFWNEGRTVHTAQSLDEGEKQVIEVAADKIDSANVGKLVYVTGETAVEGELRDEKIGLTAPAIKLKRVVEMYQWEEEKRTKDSKTTYKYDKSWRSKIQSSRNFYKSGYDNPNVMPIQSQEFVANKVTFGAFTLNDLQVARIDNEESRPLTPEEFAAVPEEIRNAAVQTNSGLYLPADKWFSQLPASERNGGFDAAANGSEEHPQVGDVRVKLYVVKPGPTSIVAEQTASSFQPFSTKAGVSISEIRPAKLTSKEMFELARKDNAFWAWVLRGAGLGVIFVSFLFLMGPLTALTDWIPGLGSLVSGGVFLIAIAGTLVVGSVAISVAWLFYRPLIATAVLIGAFLLAYLCWRMLRKKKQPELHSSGLEIVS